MQNPQFFSDQFVTSNILNQQVTDNVNNFQALTLGRGMPGLISPTAVTYSVSGLNVSANMPSPFQVLFGTGILAGAHGIINGADTQTYTASFSGVVPAAGQPETTAYLVATYQQIQQNPTVFIGPPPGHPDFNPNFQPYTNYTQSVDSLNVFATVAPPDNNTSFELFRCTLASGATGLGTISTAFQEWASSLSDLPIAALAAPGMLSTQSMNYILIGGTYTLPDASTYNSNFLFITCFTNSLVTITSSITNIYGFYGQFGAPVSNLPLPRGGSIDLEAINGTWQIIGGNALGLGIPVNTFPWTVPQGGTGLITLPAHAIMLGEGIDPVGFAGPGNPGLPLIGQGPSADPVFGAVNLNSGAVTNVLQVINGGTGDGSITPHQLITGQGTAPFGGVGPGSPDTPLIGQGIGADPVFTQLNLSSSAAITSVLQISNGGTGQSVTAYCSLNANVNGVLPIANGGTGQSVTAYCNLTANVNSILPIGNGGTGLGITAYCSLTSNVRDVLPWGNGGTNNTGYSPWGTVVVNSATSQLVATGTGLAGQFFMSNGPGTFPSYQNVPHGGASYTTAGSYTFTVPGNVYAVFARVWGAGGGGSGTTAPSPPTQGSSGGGGGYTESWIGVSPGQAITVTVGAGGSGATGGAQAGTGGTSSFGGIGATGGTGGSSGPGSGGVGAGGTYAAVGGHGDDLDGVNKSAWGGSGALGGMGGGINDAGVSYDPVRPGGGGGANDSQATGQNGADGSVVITW